jgi:eukaryotic-like serine/threonine-protein kinase
VNPVLDQRYQLLEMIGSGAAGQVWRALDQRLQRIVAVKTVDLSIHHRDPGVVARFRREAQTSAGLVSPYIASVYDHGQAGQLLFIVMEMLSGPSLDALVDADGPLDIDRGLKIGAEVASGLADAHAAGIVHRDLKPANVVLNDSVAKLVDFGIARFTDAGDQTMTSAATVAGTAAYMSPEQASGQEVTAASDLYSLGCLLFTVFTGHPPLGGTTALQQAAAHVHQTPPAFASVRPDAPPGLASLVDRLLAKDPGGRPDAAATARTLAALRKDPSIDALPDTAPLAAVDVPVPPLTATTALLEPLRPEGPAAIPKRRGSLLPWLVTLVLAVTAAVVGWTIYQQTSPAGTPMPTPTASVISPTTLGVPTISIKPTTTAPTRTTTTAATTTTTTTTTTATAPASTTTSTTTSPAATTTTTTTAPTTTPASTTKTTASTNPSATPTA